MPQQSASYHGGSGWRFSWRPNRMQRSHELGQDFALTEDRTVQSDEERAAPAITPGQPGEEGAVHEDQPAD